MLLMLQKCIRGGICHVIDQYSKAKNKCMKYYDEYKEWSYLKDWNVEILYWYAMSQKISVNDFKWVEDTSKFDEDFIKSYNYVSDEGYFFEVDVEDIKNLHDIHNDLPFLSERIKIEKVEKVVANLHVKEEYVIHIRI